MTEEEAKKIQDKAYAKMKRKQAAYEKASNEYRYAYVQTTVIRLQDAIDRGVDVSVIIRDTRYRCTGVEMHDDMEMIQRCFVKVRYVNIHGQEGTGETEYYNIRMSPKVEICGHWG